jgi:hypothetical protein
MYWVSGSEIIRELMIAFRPTGSRRQACGVRAPFSKAFSATRPSVIGLIPFRLM